MNVEKHTWYSPSLGHDMTLKVYGHYGKPIVVFPSHKGRYGDYEDRGMIQAVRPFIDSGRVKIFAVDGIDAQSWANTDIHPTHRSERHNHYDRYMTDEVLPFIRHGHGHGTQKVMVTGASMGGYHSANFFFRHPELADSLLSLSGLFNLSRMIGDYMDESVYYNSPLSYLRSLDNPWYLEQFRQSQIVLVCGRGNYEEAMQRDATHLKQILDGKGVPAWVDMWGHDANHDWPWWLKQFPYYLSKMNLN